MSAVVAAVVDSEAEASGDGPSRDLNGLKHLHELVTGNRIKQDVNRFNEKVEDKRYES